MALTQAQIQQAITDAATNYGVPPGLLLKMLQQESGLNPNVGKSSAGAAGIAQFMPDTARQYGIDPTDTSDQSVLAQIGASAHLMSDNAKQLNGGKLPSISDQEPWLKAAAAYNAGVGAVQSAEHQASQNNRYSAGGVLGSIVPGLHGDKSWTDYLPEEAKGYVNIMAGKGGSTNSATDWATNYGRTSGIVKPSTSTSGVYTPSTPGTLTPPNISDFQTDDGNGGKITDAKGYYAAWDSYMSAQQAKQKLDSGPLAQYVDDTIKDLQTQIESGKLDASKANDLLSTKVASFKNANDVYSSKAYTAGAPVGATTIPGAFSWSQGTSIPGGGTVLNPLQQALDINSQAQGLFNGMQTPQVPGIGSIMGGYGGQYGGQPGAAYTASQPPPANNPLTPGSNPQDVQSFFGMPPQNGITANSSPEDIQRSFGITPLQQAVQFQGVGDSIGSSQAYSADQGDVIRQMLAGGSSGTPPPPPPAPPSNGGLATAIAGANARAPSGVIWTNHGYVDAATGESVSVPPPPRQ